MGLFELGEGIESLSGAPLRGIGGGLGEFGGGLRTFAESLGDIGRGVSDLLAPFRDPQGRLPGAMPYSEGLVPSGGGSEAEQLPGGGGNITKRYRVNGYAATMPYRTYARAGESRGAFLIRKQAAKEFSTNAV